MDGYSCIIGASDFLFFRTLREIFMWKTILTALALSLPAVIPSAAQASPLSIFEGTWKGLCRNLVPDPVRPERAVFEMERRISPILLRLQFPAEVTLSRTSCCQDCLAGHLPTCN